MDIFMPQYFPLRWQPMDCTANIYRIFPVHPTSIEYHDVVYNLPNGSVNKVFRVQHPLAYMRYIIEGEKMIHIVNDDCSENIVYHVLHQEDLIEALMVNCDVRYYKQRSYFTPLLDLVNIPSNNDYCLMLIKKRGRNPDMTQTKNHYPMYIIYFC